MSINELVQTYLLKIIIQPLDDIVLLLSEPCSALLLGQVEDGLVEFLPKLDTTVGNLVDGLSELRGDGENATGRLVVGLLPLVVLDTRSVNNHLLDRLAGVGFLGDHNARSEEETIVRHGLHAKLGAPFTGEVRPNILDTTESRASDEDEVRVLSDGVVGGEHRLMEVLGRVMTTCTTTSPLHHDRKVGVVGSNVDDLTDTINGSRLEADVLDAGSAKAVNDLNSLLGGGNTGSNAKALDRQAFLAHLLDQGKLEGPLTLCGLDRNELWRWLMSRDLTYG